MDITVSRLNERMALRVPSELPLGLVFIVGQVQAIRPYPPEPDKVALQLTDGEHSLPCRLPWQVAEEMQLAGNERVRAGGHLLFDTREARYYLLARDIEVLPSLERGAEGASARLHSAAAEGKGGSGALATGELPPWVRQLAPLEVHPELGLSPAPARAGLQFGADDEASPLPPELVDYLSQAIDSDQEIELTPSLVHELLERHTATSPDPAASEAEPLDRSEVAAERSIVGRQEISVLAYATPANLADDSVVLAQELPASPSGAAEQSETDAAGDQKRRQPSQRRQMLLLVAGVAALFIFILLVFVVIALVAGYTPFLVP